MAERKEGLDRGNGNWKKDLDDVVMEKMTIDDFLERWSGRETKDSESNNVEGKEEKKPWHADEDAKAKVLRLLAEVRKKIGV